MLPLSAPASAIPTPKAHKTSHKDKLAKSVANGPVSESDNTDSNASALNPALVYFLFQSVWFMVLAALIMRLKLFLITQLIVLATQICNKQVRDDMIIFSNFGLLIEAMIPQLCLFAYYHLLLNDHSVVRIIVSLAHVQGQGPLQQVHASCSHRTCYRGYGRLADCVVSPSDANC